MINTPMFYLVEITRAARPLHWIKNFAIFAALVFTGTLLIQSYLINVIWAFISFSLAASSIYIFNDVQDKKNDQLHPIKKSRPIASGKLPINIALTASASFALVSLFIAANLNYLFLLTIITYIALQVVYSLGLKNLAIFDILIIATGFILRVAGGAFVINAHLSVWFLLCVLSVSLFLASGKRRAELGSVSGISGQTRKSLTHYSKSLLDSYVTMFGNATWMSWALFTFFESPPARLDVWLFFAEISKATTVSKLLMATIPIVIFIIMKYESLIFENRSEAPEKLLLTDKALVAAIIIYGGMVIVILYGGLAVI